MGISGAAGRAAARAFVALSGDKECPCGCGQRIQRWKLVCVATWLKAPARAKELLSEPGREARREGAQQVLEFARAMKRLKDGV